MKIRKCVVPIAGYGTRLFPATRSVPKALFPIVDTDGVAKPVVQIILQEAFGSGAEEACLVVQEDQKDAIEGYFSGEIPEALKKKDDLRDMADRVRDMGRRVRYVLQDRQEGFGHAVYMARDFVGGEPFLVLLGDHIYISKKDVSCARQVIDVYRKYGKSVAGVAETPESELHNFGTIGGSRVEEGAFKVSALVEKPGVDYARKNLRIDGLREGFYLCNFGIDVLTPAIFDIIGYNIKNNVRSRGEFQLRDAMDELRRREGLYACVVEGERYDIGTPKELIKTVAGYGLGGPYGEELSKYLMAIVKKLFYD